MSQDKPIIISVPFHGDSITTIETPAGVFVPVKPICERLGIDWKSQHRKFGANTRWGMVILTIPSAGGDQEMTCIPQSKVFGWLGTISPNKVNPELAAKLRVYQDEADSVLDRHFRLRAAETSARIEELERHLWHCHMHLREDNQKWGRAYLAMERGASDYTIAYRNNLTMARWMEEKAMMQNCAMIPNWRSDMETLRSQNEELRWQADRQKRQAKQKDLFEAVNVQ